jgi:predicted RNA-binding Zn ribbon-like protein
MMKHEFDLCGGHLALDFANTLTSRHTATPRERLSDYAELVAFARQSGLLTASAARRLEALGRDRAYLAEEVRQEAVRLREALYAVFRAVAEQRAPAVADLAIVNASVARLRLGPEGDWTFAARDDGLDEILGPIVRAAALLYTTPERGRIRVCEAPDCVWLFFDGSKNHSRRWCDMAQCGNRMKARRHYERGRETRTERR